MLAPLLIATALLTATYLYNRLWYTRYQKYAHLPQVTPSLLLGHLKILGEYVRRHKPKAHADLGIIDMHKAAGRPPIMLMDLRPINAPLVVVGSHEVAEQISKASAILPWSAPKSPGYHDRLFYIMGKTSILGAEGEEWKRLRKRFNPGFAPQYLESFIPEILDKGMLFLERLDARVKSQEPFSLISLTMQLTFDVIGKVVLETDLDAQRDDRSGVIRVYEELLDEYKGEVHNLPWWLTPMKVWRRAGVAGRIHEQLKGIVRRKYGALGGRGRGVGGKGVRSVLSLSLQEVERLTPQVLEETADQLRTFLFAGHDTTSILISWIFYELSRTPHALKAVRAEVEGLFGPDAADPASIRDCLLERGDLLQNMPYVNAVIKETLRFHPPAGTGRYIPPGSGFNIRLPDGEQFCGDGLLYYISQSIVHRDPSVYGETADDFLPERWLEGGQDIPAGAWRPYERGPRNCIGQELANIEARVIVAMAVRRYEFVKVGLGEVVLDEETGLPILDPAKKGKQYRVSEELYPTRNVTSKPVDGMMVRIRAASA